MMDTNSNFSVWKTLLSFLLLLSLSILVSISYTSFVVKQKKKTKVSEALPVVKEVQNISIFQHATEEIHFVLQPYFFDEQQMFHDKIFNEALNDALPQATFTYYKLWIVNFTLPDISFVDMTDTISLSLLNGSVMNNIPLSPMMGKVNHKQSTFFSTFFQPKLLAPGHMKAYLLAFPSTLSWEQIQNTDMSWQSKKYKLLKRFCLHKDFQEYLQNPNPLFWQKKDEKNK